MQLVSREVLDLKNRLGLDLENPAFSVDPEKVSRYVYYRSRELNETIESSESRLPVTCITCSRPCAFEGRKLEKTR